jgi:plasmid maintenance system antidote protein VapI
MSIAKDKKREDFDLTIAPSDGQKWSKEERALMEERAQLIHGKRSPERIIKNQMLGVLYRMEEYVQNDKITLEEKMTIEDFVMTFCSVLGLGKSQFATYLDTDLSNLNKYLKGQRAFNKDLAMKLASFFHRPVYLWLKVQLKNDLIALHEEEKSAEKYSKYDYEKVLQIA